MPNAQRRLWYVQGFDGPQQSLDCCLPAKTSGKQIQILLQRLAARHLSPDQLVKLTLQNQRSNALRPQISDRCKISLEIADGKYRYVAQIVSELQLAELKALAS